VAPYIHSPQCLYGVNRENVYVIDLLESLLIIKRARAPTPTPALYRHPLHNYKVESNENLTSAIKIRNTARLSCKLAGMILMVWRMADRWQYDAGMQRDGHSNMVKTAAPLATRTEEEQRN
jgi:hypothetical protein